MEWVLLHARNGEQFAGLVDVSEDLKDDDKLYKRCVAADIMQPKVGLVRHAQSSTEDQADNVIELRNPHQVIVQAGDGKQVIACLPMNVGDRIIFLRAGEILYVQFLDEKSPIVVEIRKSAANIVSPGEAGETRTAGGIVIPGGKP